MTYDPQNIFAKILRGEIPCNKAYEDECVLAFHDIAPKAPVHVVVIPKKEYVSFEDFTAGAAAEEAQIFWQSVRKTAAHLGLQQGGYRLITNHGPNSGQEVPHFHVHILGGGRVGALVG